MEAGPSISSEILDAINRLERRTGAALTRRDAPPSRTALRRAPPPPATPRSRRWTPRRVHFDDGPPRRPFGDSPRRYAPRGGGWSPSPRPSSDQMPTSSTTVSSSTSLPRVQAPSPSPTATGCTNYGRIHAFGDCIAFGKFCRACGKRNHFAVCCRSAPHRE